MKHPDEDAAASQSRQKLHNTRTGARRVCPGGGCKHTQKMISHLRGGSNEAPHFWTGNKSTEKQQKMTASEPRPLVPSPHTRRIIDQAQPGHARPRGKTGG